MKIQELSARVTPLPWRAHKTNLLVEEGASLATFDPSVWQHQLDRLSQKELDEFHEQARLNAAFTAHCCSNFMKAVRMLRFVREALATRGDETKRQLLAFIQDAKEYLEEIEDLEDVK